MSDEPRTAGSGRRGARDPERAGRTITKPAAETKWHGYPGYVADRNGHQWDIAHYSFVPQMLLPHD